MGAAIGAEIPDASEVEVTIEAHASAPNKIEVSIRPFATCKWLSIDIGFSVNEGALGEISKPVDVKCAHPPDKTWRDEDGEFHCDVCEPEDLPAGCLCLRFLNGSCPVHGGGRS